MDFAFHLSYKIFHEKDLKVVIKQIKSINYLHVYFRFVLVETYTALQYLNLTINNIHNSVSHFVNKLFVGSFKNIFS